DRHPGFRAGNDRTLEHAQRSDRRLIPFVRLDLTEEPIEEAERCLALGARGIKLHPRAQRFLLNDERLAPVFALAAERKVPLLIGVRTARLAGFDEEALEKMLWGNAKRIADGEPPLEPTKPRGSDTFSQPMQLARIHQYLSMATPLLWTRQPDTIGILGLALNACHELNGREREVDQIRELLEIAPGLWRSLPEEKEPDRITAARATFRLIHLADIVAVTSGA